MKEHNFGRPLEIPLKNSRVAASTDRYDIWMYPVINNNGAADLYETCVRPNRAFVIAEKDGQIIFTKQTEYVGAPVKTALIGGDIRSGMEPKRAAEYHLFDMAGMTSDKFELVGSIQYTDQIIQTYYVYIARNCKIVGEPKKKIDLIGADPDKFMSDIMMRSDFRDRFIRDILIKQPSQTDMTRFQNLVRQR
ncbi:hypothetical protein LJC18_04025 [Lachnospiraceae bacterium OttesenSCG-928-E19]|nr:hypothetical protein [Lachnospiraceae bacterium OttesenSCG-928-E19]